MVIEADQDGNIFADCMWAALFYLAAGVLGFLVWTVYRGVTAVLSAIDFDLRLKQIGRLIGRGGNPAGVVRFGASDSATERSAGGGCPLVPGRGGQRSALSPRDGGALADGHLSMCHALRSAADGTVDQRGAGTRASGKPVWGDAARPATWIRVGATWRYGMTYRTTNRKTVTLPAAPHRCRTAALNCPRTSRARSPATASVRKSPRPLP